MNKALISLIFVVLFVMGSCGGDDTEGKFKPSDCTGDFPNYHKGLCWSDASSSSMSWYKAKEYCKNLGGRLPTISELRTLIQNCQGTETGGECGVTDSCLSSADCWNDPCYGCEYDESGKYSVFGDTYWFWSSSEPSGNADYAWGVNFKRGGVYGYSKYGYKGDDYYVRCLR